MKSGILSLNKGLFQQQTRSISWIGIFFTLALVIMLPLSILIRHLTYSDSYYEGGYTDNFPAFNPIFEFSFPIQLIAYATFPVLLAIILVNFTTKKSATDFMHSLPFTRQSILTHTYVVGSLALLLPILITGVLVGILRPFLTEQFYTLIDVTEWVGISYLIVLFIFIFTIMIGMFVGSGLLHAGLTYLMIFFPASIIVLAFINLQYYVNGLALTRYIEELMTNGVFFVRLVELNNRPFTLLEYLIYTLLAAVFVAISYIAYTKRPSEATDQSIVFPFFRYLFLYGLTLFSMLIAGFYFSEIQQGSLAWTLVGYILGAFIAYTVLQMILQKTLRLTWPWKGFVIYGVIVALLIIPVNFVAGFYENAVPEIDEVSSVQINPYYDSNEKTQGLKDKKAIELVIEMHKSLVDHKAPDRYHYNTANISIEYDLTNGRTLSREYTVDVAYLEEISLDLRSNDAFKQAYEPINKLKDLNDLAFATVYDANASKPIRIADLGDLKELVSALEKDIENEPSQQLLNYGVQQYIGDIEFSRTNDDGINITLSQKYENTIKWLVDNGYSNSLMLPESIDSATIIKVNDEDRMEIESIVYENLDHSLLPDPKLETTDPSEIEALFEVAHAGYYGDYVVLFTQEDEDRYQYYGFDTTEAPDFILEALQ